MALLSVSQPVRARLQGQISRSLRPIDQLVSARSTAPSVIVFVVGVPRGGTTIAYQTLAALLELSFFTRLFDFGWPMPNTTARVQRLLPHSVDTFESHLGRTPRLLAPAENSRVWARWMAQTPGGLYRIDSRGTVSEDMHGTLMSVATILGYPLLVKNLYLVGSIVQLAEAFPRAVFIRVRRDPVASARSIVTARLASGNTRDWWSFRPPGYEAHITKPIRSQACFQVASIEKLLDSAFDSLEDQRTWNLDYSDLTSHPAETAERIVDWGGTVGVRARLPAPSLVSVIKKAPPLPDDHLTASLRRELIAAECPRVSWDL